MDISRSRLVGHIICLFIALFTFFILWNARLTEVSGFSEVGYQVVLNLSLMGGMAFIALLWLINFILFLINSRESVVEYKSKHLSIPAIINVILVVIAVVLATTGWFTMSLPVRAVTHTIFGFDVWMYYAVAIVIMVILSVIQSCLLQARGSIPVWNNYYRKVEVSAK